MKFKRVIPPTAPPLYLKDILLYGIGGLVLANRNIKKLESEIKEYFGAKYVFPVSSGKASLTLILLALKSLSKKQEVLIPAYTCFSVPSAIVKAGLKVTLCDIDPLTLDFDYKLLNEAINQDTLCVVPNHLFGIPSDIDRILSLCRKRGIFVVEDAAQAMGGLYKGRKLGTIGDAAFFSLGRGKNITCGSGGIIITNSAEIGDAIQKYYSHLKRPSLAESIKEFFQIMLMSLFIHPALYWIPKGLPFLKLGETIFYRDFPIRRLSGMKAGFLMNWRNHLMESNGTRTELADYFIERLPFKANHLTSIPYLRFPVFLDSRKKRDRIYFLSQRCGLGISLMYPTAINEIEEIRGSFNSQVFPSARKVAGRLIAIPTHYLLSEKDKEAICELFNEAETQ